MSLDSFVTYVLDPYTPQALVLRIPSAIFAANGSSRLAIRARRDSIGRPWPIDPTSKAVFGELKGGTLCSI